MDNLAFYKVTQLQVDLNKKISEGKIDLLKDEIVVLEKDVQKYKDELNGLFLNM